jgi:hypothetical protein
MLIIGINVAAIYWNSPNYWQCQYLYYVVIRTSVMIMVSSVTLTRNVLYSFFVLEFPLVYYQHCVDGC